MKFTFDLKDGLYMSDMKSFKDRIIYLREYSGAKTDREFAKMVGISVENFNSYKRGSLPTVDKLSNILHAMKGLNGDWLVSGIGESFPEKCETNEINDFTENYGSTEITNREEFIEMKVKYEFMTKEYDFLKGELSKSTDTIRNLSAVVRKKNTAGSA